MTLRFAASEVYSTTYVVAARRAQAEAWVRRQTRPARFTAGTPLAVGSDRSGDPDVIVLAATFTAAQRVTVERHGMANGWRMRQVYA